MLPLSGSSLPSSAASLADSLRAGLAAHDLHPREVAANGVWPALELLRLDFTGVKLTVDRRLPVTAETPAASFSAGRFELVAAPAEIASVPVEIGLHASRAAFGFARSSGNEELLLLVGAEAGEVSLEAGRIALEALLFGLAKKAASEQGVDIKKVRLELISESPRRLNFKAEVTAKVFIATAVATLSGRLEVDDRLVARLSNLQFAGEGLLGGVAGGFVRPQLAKFEGREAPLLDFALGAIKLRDVQLAGGESLTIRAQFSS